MPQTGKMLMIAGICIFSIGMLFWWSENHKFLSWFGHLPGDIRIERDNFKFFMPIASMLIVSIIASILFWIFRKLSS